MSDDRYKGQEVIKLLREGLDTETLVEIVQKYYQSASRQIMDEVGTAIDLCNAALERLKDSTDPNAPYSRGKFYLLLASIYLNENRDLKLAEENFYQSIKQFKSRQLSHLEALACLGSAITKRKLDNPEEAIIDLDSAKKSVNLESIHKADKIALDNLRKAIEEENLNIRDYFAPEEKPQEESGPTEKSLSIFNISAGQRCVATGGTADLNLLSLGDYEYDTPRSQEVIIDLTKCYEAENADYILEIDTDVNQAKSGLHKGDWLLIRSKNTLNSLTGKRVAVLTQERDEIWASLKTFSYAEDHYLLKGQSKGDASIVIAGYKSQNLSKIIEYYEGYGEVNKKFVYDVQVSGEVIKSIPRASIKDVTKPAIWRIPILNNIAAGIGMVVEEMVESYTDLDEQQGQDIDFGVRVAGDSMTGDNIFPGDIALIHQQPIVEKGEIAAVVITTSEETIEVLKHYYHYSDQEDLEHWWLKSSNPSHIHLLVIPSGVNTEKIQSFYTEVARMSKTPMSFKVYKDAELTIAGRYVRIIRRN